MSSYNDIQKTQNFKSLLKNEEYSNVISKNQTQKPEQLSIKSDSNLKENSKEIWTTEYILGIYKSISEI